MTRSARAYLATAVIVLALLLGLAVVANPFGDDSPAPEPGEPTASSPPTLAPTPSVRPRPATGPGTPDRILIPSLEFAAPAVPLPQLEEQTSALQALTCTPYTAYCRNKKHNT